MACADDPHEIAKRAAQLKEALKVVSVGYASRYRTLKTLLALVGIPLWFLSVSCLLAFWAYVFNNNVPAFLASFTASSVGTAYLGKFTFNKLRRHLERKLINQAATKPKSIGPQQGSPLAF